MRILPQRRNAVLNSGAGRRPAWDELQRRHSSPADPLPHKWYAARKTDMTQAVVGATYIGEHLYTYRTRAIREQDRSHLTPSYIPYGTYLNPNIHTEHDITREVACLLVGHGALLERIGPSAASVKYLDPSTEHTKLIERLVEKTHSRHANIHTSRAAIFAAGHLVLLDPSLMKTFTEYDVELSLAIRETLQSKRPSQSASPSPLQLQFLAAAARLIRAVYPDYPTAFPTAISSLADYLVQQDSAYVGGDGHARIDAILTQQNFNDLLRDKKTTLNERFQPI